MIMEADDEDEREVDWNLGENLEGYTLCPEERKSKWPQMAFDTYFIWDQLEAIVALLTALSSIRRQI